eukprot:GHVP01034837.1.p1 GENE.GHVP01034837.1~~GHVP01034837.1.p1  ORF type:complete len:331 (+),score=50.76 GHVP01034837.1:47-1039(+)
MNPQAHLPWVEKYRPRKISEIVHQEHVKEVLLKIAENQNMPHLLFYGPPGTGKTSAIHALSRELFKDQWKSRVFELNASDERGIAVVRDKIKGWTKTVVSNKGGNTPPWKIVVLDEADMMTSDAQSALRRIVEDSSKNTRFVFICNYITKIIDPLKSRCSQFRFEPIEPEAQIEKLTHVSQLEGLNLDDQAIKRITQISEGDMRVGITLLQTVRLFAPEGEQVRVEDVESCAGVPSKTVADQFFTAAGCGKIETEVDTLMRGGWDMNQLLRQIHLRIISNYSFSDEFKALMSFEIGQAEYRLIYGSSESLQLLKVGLDLQGCLNDPKYLK